MTESTQKSPLSAPENRFRVPTLRDWIGGMVKFARVIALPAVLATTAMVENEAKGATPETQSTSQAEALAGQSLTCFTMGKKTPEQAARDLFLKRAGATPEAAGVTLEITEARKDDLGTTVFRVRKAAAQEAKAAGPAEALAGQSLTCFTMGKKTPEQAARDLFVKKAGATPEAAGVTLEITEARKDDLGTTVFRVRKATTPIPNFKVVEISNDNKTIVFETTEPTRKDEIAKMVLLTNLGFNQSILNDFDIKTEPNGSDKSSKQSFKIILTPKESHTDVNEPSLLATPPDHKSRGADSVGQRATVDALSATPTFEVAAANEGQAILKFRKAMEKKYKGKEFDIITPIGKNGNKWTIRYQERPAIEGLNEKTKKEEPPISQLSAQKDRENVKRVPLNDAGFDRLRQESKRRIQSCYDSELKRDSSLAGKITAKIVIGEDGRVSSIAFPKNGKTLNNSAIEQCIHKVIKGWLFKERSEEAEIDLPFTFGAK